MVNHKTLFYILLLLISINLITSWKCGADQIKIKPKSIELKQVESKRKLANSYENIRIIPDYSNLRATSGISNEIIEKVRRLIDDTCNEFSKILKVIPSAYNLAGYENTIKQSCDIDYLGSGYENYLIENDLVIFPTFDSTLASNVLAAAGMCMYLSANHKPLMGIVLINPNLSFTKKNTELYMKNLFFHELTHVLVFTPELFSSLGMTYTRIFEGKFVSFVNSPRVLTAARQHFNCPTITGIPLESQGGTGSAGSHWEARYMLGDYMISTNYIDNVISDITLALFEDSGLYKVNYYSGGLFKFGKNMGCEFFNQNCIEGGSTSFPNDFCTVQNQPFCSRTKLMKGQCIITSQDDTIPKRYRYFDDSSVGGFAVANYCPVSNYGQNSDDYYPSSCSVGTSSLNTEYGELIGNSSFCFISSLLPSSSQLSTSERAICYKVECDSENMQIVVNIGNKKINCSTDGGVITNPSGFKGSIYCPEYYEICGQETENEGEICNDMYKCFSKKAETNINTISFFPDEDYYYRKVNKGIFYFKYNYNLILLLLLLYI